MFCWCLHKYCNRPSHKVACKELITIWQSIGCWNSLQARVGLNPRPSGTRWGVKTPNTETGLGLKPVILRLLNVCIYVSAGLLFGSDVFRGQPKSLCDRICHESKPVMGSQVVKRINLDRAVDLTLNWPIEIRRLSLLNCVDYRYGPPFQLSPVKYLTPLVSRHSGAISILLSSFFTKLSLRDAGPALICAQRG